MEKIKSEFDFGGYATRVGRKCSDGRTIMQNAFQDNDGNKVPLVWQHMHNEVKNVLGHAILENRPDGVYAFCSLNKSAAATDAKEAIRHKDIKALSIYANNLVEKEQHVIHGKIREVSLVIAGANPDAYIDFINFQHGDGMIVESETEAVICSNDDIDIIEHVEEEQNLSGSTEHAEEEQNLAGSTEHAEEEQNLAGSIEHAEKETTEDKELDLSGIFETFTDKQKEAVFGLMAIAMEEESEEVKSLPKAKDGEESIGEIMDTLSEDQKEVAFYLVGTAAEKKDELKQTNFEGDTMKKNVFDGSMDDDNKLTHDDLAVVFKTAQKTGSLREAFLQHDYGIQNIDYLFPDAKTVSAKPAFIKRATEWVEDVFGGAHKSPFSRIKSIAADITADEARAKGYVKGAKKVEEIIVLLKRTTSPTTVYKKQKLDRDDIIDIIDLDVVAWLKVEMRMLLEEELGRAMLVGDGRTISAEDKIDESRIRPIYKDDPLYSVRVLADEATTTAQMIDLIILARKNYKGSGNPSFYATADVIGDMLLLKDSTGRRLYNTINDLAAGLRVKKIVEVPVMENVSREITPAASGVEGESAALMGIVVNMADYYLGADKGGAINMFDDFDIDFNQYKYLIETRCSGALVLPHAALVIEKSVTVPALP